MSYTRTPDRRKSGRGESDDNDGRRARKRFVLEDDYVVKVITEDRQAFYADMLDVSLSGVYLVVISDQWMPVAGERVEIHFKGNGDHRDGVVSGQIKYTNPGSLLGMSDCGLGVYFDGEISSLLVRGEDGSISLVGNELIAHTSGREGSSSQLSDSSGLIGAAR